MDAMNTGCRFADRCPFAMPMCRESAPPLYRTADQRAVACYLYRGEERVLEGDIAQVFRARDTVATGGVQTVLPGG